MPYIEGRVVHDADAHIMEEPTWLIDHADPDVREKLRPNVELGLAPGEAEAIEKAIERHADPEFRARDAEEIMARKNFKATGGTIAADRPLALDLLGVASQLVFNTFNNGNLLRLERSGDLDLAYGAARAHNRGMVEFCSVDPRLLPTCYVPLADFERSLQSHISPERRLHQAAACWDLRQVEPARRALHQAEQLGLSQRKLHPLDQALYDKLQCMELGVSAALVADSATHIAPELEALDGRLPPWVPGYRARVLVGRPGSRLAPRRGSCRGPPVVGDDAPGCGEFRLMARLAPALGKVEPLGSLRKLVGQLDRRDTVDPERPSTGVSVGDQVPRRTLGDDAQGVDGPLGLGAGAVDVAEPHLDAADHRLLELVEKPRGPVLDLA